MRREAPELAEIFESPNDILAVEYLKSARKYPHLGMRTVKRIKTKSATEIRNTAREGGALEGIPDYAVEVFKDAPMSQLNIFYDMQWSLLTIDNALYRVPSAPGTFDCESGVINRLQNVAGVSFDGNGMFEKAATKKFTASRLRRAALFRFLHVKKSDLELPVEATMLLASDLVGRKMLAEMRRNSECPIRILTKSSKAFEDESLKLMVSADVFAAMCFRPMIPPNQFLIETPFIKI